MSQLPQSLIDILKGINIAEDTDIAFIAAATINMYCESMRRVHNRVILTPQDACNIFHMMDVLLVPTEAPPPEELRARSRKLTAVEEQELLGAVEAEVKPVERRA